MKRTPLSFSACVKSKVRGFAEIYFAGMIETIHFILCFFRCAKTVTYVLKTDPVFFIMSDNPLAHCNGTIVHQFYSCGIFFFPPQPRFMTTLMFFVWPPALLSIIHQPMINSLFSFLCLSLSNSIPSPPPPLDSAGDPVYFRIYRIFNSNPLNLHEILLYF